MPPRDSVLDSNWNKKRSDAQEKVYVPAQRELRMLPTVKQLINEIDLVEAEVFKIDGVHMTREATKKLNIQLWTHVDRIAAEHEETETHLPVVIWDYNPTTKHLTQNMSEHAAFWTKIATWGITTGTAERDSLRRQINKIVSQGRKDEAYYNTCFKKNRRSVEGTVNPDHDKSAGWLTMKTLPHDESHLNEDDEFDGYKLGINHFLPPRHPGKTQMFSGILIDIDERENTEHSIDQCGLLWTMALDKIMHRAGMSKRKDTIQFAKGKPRALFNAIAKLYSIDEPELILADAIAKCKPTADQIRNAAPPEAC